MRALVKIYLRDPRHADAIPRLTRQFTVFQAKRTRDLHAASKPAISVEGPSAVPPRQHASDEDPATQFQRSMAELFRSMGSEPRWLFNINDIHDIQRATVRLRSGREDPQKLLERVDKRLFAGLNDLPREKLTKMHRRLSSLLRSKHGAPSAPFGSRQELLLWVARIFQDVPEEIADEEMRHILFFGYCSDGQSHYVVSGVQHDTLHLRIKANTFRRVSQSCKEIIDKTQRLRIVISDDGQPVAVVRRGILQRWRMSAVHVELGGTIHVLEPGNALPTIKGHIVHPWDALEREKVHAWLTLFAGLLIVILVVSSLWSLAHAPISGVRPVALSGALGATWTTLGGQPIFPSLLVFFVSNLVPVLVRAISFWRERPVQWDNEVGER